MDEKENLKMLQKFNIESLPDLDVAVMGALELFDGQALAKIDISKYRKPLVVGSGNAEATGRIVFESSDAVFASESSFEEKLSAIPAIDEVVIVSASGAKHAPIIAKYAKDAGKHVTLITCTEGSLAQKALSSTELEAHVYPKNREPYTYNTSTYMAMILGASGESPAAIHDFITNNVATIDFPNFSEYDKYYLIVPPEFSGIIRMLEVKFIELFGRKIARDVETSEYVKHATTVTDSGELFINFGKPNTTWGDPNNRLNVPLPEAGGYASIMAVGYWVISQIQKAQPQYFKENIADYCRFISGIFGEELSPIVEA